MQLLALCEFGGEKFTTQQNIKH